MDIKLPFSTTDIQKFIPHRYPFLLIDRVTELKPNEFIKATKCVSLSDPILQGHFPGNPIVPGVLQIEGMAQAAAVLGLFTAAKQGETVACRLADISSARFRSEVVPGDVIEYHVKVVKQRHSFFWFEGEGRVDNKVALQVKFSAKMD